MTDHPAIRVSVEAEAELARQLQNYWILKAVWWTSPIVMLVATYLLWDTALPVGLLGGLAYCLFCQWMLNQCQNVWLPSCSQEAEAAAPPARREERRIAMAQQLQTGGIQEMLSEAWVSEDKFLELKGKLAKLSAEREAELAWEAKREQAFDLVRQVVDHSDDVLRERMLHSM